MFKDRVLSLSLGVNQNNLIHYNPYYDDLVRFDHFVSLAQIIHNNWLKLDIGLIKELRLNHQFSNINQGTASKRSNELFRKGCSCQLDRCLHRQAALFQAKIICLARALHEFFPHETEMEETRLQPVIYYCRYVYLLMSQSFQKLFEIGTDCFWECIGP